MEHEHDIHEALARRLNSVGMAYPITEHLVDILKANFSPEEARVALAIPGNVIPLLPAAVDTIHAQLDIPRDELVKILESLSQRGLLFTHLSEKGEKQYALHQVGFGFPQTFFWADEDSPHARKMAEMVAKYFNRHVTREAYGTPTKPFRYIPVDRSLKTNRQAIVPFHIMEAVIEGAKNLAVAHCGCRVAYRLVGRGCNHPTEVCMKFDDMAQYVIEQGLAREITKGEAFEIIKKSEDAGLVHLVDNSEAEIKHCCNCCGCACWNVGSIRRHKIPRDALMATYFMRETDEKACTGCGACLEICPVDCVKLEDNLAVCDEEWCIGCGLCATVCPTGAVSLRLRDDNDGQVPAVNFTELHTNILRERQCLK